MRNPSSADTNVVQASKRSKAPLILAAFASVLLAFGVASAVFLWKFPSIWNAATTRSTAVFRVQSRSMEPTFCGPRFVWRCPECGEAFATSLDVGASVASASFLNVRRPTFDVLASGDSSEESANAAEGSNADSPEVRRFRETARFFVCPRCGFDRAPASSAVFQDGALVEFTSRFEASDGESDDETNDGALKKARHFFRRAFSKARATNRPKRWDVVIFRDPAGRATLKRVVGLPGETVEIRGGDVFIDGKIARRSLDETFASATRVDSVAFRRTDSRLAFVRVSPIWNDSAPPSDAVDPQFPRTTFVPTPISNESPIPRWNGVDVAPVEPVRDFIARFSWANSDGLPARFAVLARRPARAFLLEFDEKARRVALRSIPLIDGKTTSGKTFDALTQVDFRDAPSEKTTFAQDPADVGDRAPIFSVFLVDGELALTRDARELARFSTGDLDSTAAAAISEPFAILGDVARVGSPTLKRDLHYSSLDAAAREPGASNAVVPPLRYFLLGDNSPASLDSRFAPFGTIAENDVLFRVVRRPPSLDDF